MTLTPEQTAAILAELSVDLATVTDDRLIELCLLYRSAPSVLPSFTNALATEITRRFTAAEIAANDVMFSVIQNFSNTFDSLANYQARMYELSTTDVNFHDDWFRNNATLFYDVLHNAEALAWLVTQTELVAYILASTVAFDAVFGSSVATAAFFNSQISMTAIIASTSSMSAVTSSTVAMTAVAASSTAMSVVASSSVAMTVVVASSIAMTAIAASSIAMTAIAASSTALPAIVKSTVARNALMNSNLVFQENRAAIYNTVKANWSKQVGISGITFVNTEIGNVNTAVANPTGFVFASLGYNEHYISGQTQITHPNRVLAAAKGTSKNPTTLDNLDAISFNGAKFKAIIDQGGTYAELWIPPAI